MPIRHSRKRKEPFRLSLGTRGEMAGWAYLSKKGYSIKEKNYRCPAGEIDVVAEKDGRISFVEIKTRSQKRFGSPLEAVHEAKQRKLVRVAQWYLKSTGKTERGASFAVLGITWKGPGEPEYRLIENAFTADIYMK